jgi:DGQHR domain-containing protein
MSTEQNISFSVIKVTQPLGDFFIGSIPAKDVVSISFADVRRIEERDIEKYLGIQRPLDRKGRVKKIKDYLRSPDAAFPTGIVLAVNQNCVEFDGRSNKLILRPFSSEFTNESIPLDKIARILDGQHRIAAFTNEDGSFDTSFNDLADSFQFNVVVFVGLDIDEQANIFATVNLAQTKVNKSLVYDLEGLSKTRSPFRTCHQIAVVLDSADERSPLFHRIKRLGVKTQGRDTSEPLTQAGFVESLIRLISDDPFADRTKYLNGKQPKRATDEELKKRPFRNLFIDEKDNDIALILFNYFTAIQSKWPTAWSAIAQEGNILPRSNAFKALMRYLRIAYLQVVGNNFGRVPKANEFSAVFENLNVSDTDFTSGTFKPGSGGESSFYKLLTLEKTIQDLKN